MVRVGREGGLVIDPPAADAVLAARHCQMRDAAPVLDTDQEQGFAGDQRRRGIENRIGLIREVGGYDDRILRMPGEQLVEPGVCHDDASFVDGIVRKVNPEH